MWETTYEIQSNVILTSVYKTTQNKPVKMKFSLFVITTRWNDSTLSLKNKQTPVISTSQLYIDETAVI